MSNHLRTRVFTHRGTDLANGLAQMGQRIPGIEIRPRGATDESLAATIRAMAEPADLIVLDGHGSGRRPVFCNGSKKDSASAWFAPESLGAPRVIMSMCHGLHRHYIKALTDCNTEVEIVGPVARITGPESARLVCFLVEQFHLGTQLSEALKEARRLGVKEVEHWDRSCPADRNHGFAA